MALHLAFIYPKRTEEFLGSHRHVYNSQQLTRSSAQRIPDVRTREVWPTSSIGRAADS